jgi:hypothetical protein
MGGKRSSHLHQNRHGMFYFRRAIPVSISRNFAHREIYRSLQTKIYRDATVLRSGGRAAH